MKKDEVLKYCNKKSFEGWMTHKMILEIFDDSEDIPDEIVELICYPPKPRKEPVIIMSKQLMEQIDIACVHMILSEMVMNDNKS